MEILNRKARFNYFIIEEIECGIELFGSEVKSIRNGNCNIKDSYGVIRNNEVYLINMFIKNYKEASIFNKEETRKRKLLLHKPNNTLTLFLLKYTFKGTKVYPSFSIFSFNLIISFLCNNNL